MRHLPRGWVLDCPTLHVRSLPSRTAGRGRPAVTDGDVCATVVRDHHETSRRQKSALAGFLPDRESADAVAAMTGHVLRIESRRALVDPSLQPARTPSLLMTLTKNQRLTSGS